MAEKYNALVAKVRDWSNKPEEATVPTSVIKDCLNYSADEIYRTLRIPPLEKTVKYTITDNDNAGAVTTDFNRYTTIPIPKDLIRFIYVRQAPSEQQQSIVFDEYTDERTFFDANSFKYSRYNWVRRGDNLFIHPMLKAGTVVEIHYYRRLAPLDALYLVIKQNYVMNIADNAQPYLDPSNSTSGTPLYVTATAAYNSLAEIPSSDTGTPVTKYFVGKEVPHWLKDNNERLLMWGALQNLGAYLKDEVMEARYNKSFTDNMATLNQEEKMRRALGGNVQVTFNSRSMI